MTSDDARCHAAAWTLAAERLEKIAEAQIMVIDGKRIASSTACAVVDLARAVANSYTELADKIK